MLTLNPLCREGIDYVEEQLLLRGFDKRGKLFVRRSGPIVATVYPRWEHGNVENYVIGSEPIWFCPDTIVRLRDNVSCTTFLTIIGRMAAGTVPVPTPEHPFRKVTKISNSSLEWYLRHGTPELLQRYFGMPLEPLRWDIVQEVLDCTFFAPLDFLATYEGNRSRAEFMTQRYHNLGHIMDIRYHYLYEKKLLEFKNNLLEEEQLLKEAVLQKRNNPKDCDSIYWRDLKVLQAAENGDWGPAEQLLAKMSAGGLALLKRYHIQDKGPYPKEFARLCYDD